MAPISIVLATAAVVGIGLIAFALKRGLDKADKVASILSGVTGVASLGFAIIGFIVDSNNNTDTTKADGKISATLTSPSPPNSVIDSSKSPHDDPTETIRATAGEERPDHPNGDKGTDTKNNPIPEATSRVAPFPGPFRDGMLCINYNNSGPGACMTAEDGNSGPGGKPSIVVAYEDHFSDASTYPENAEWE
ncbi:hypothetical protein [Microbispora triticiradicis]|uniref:hypothetical protein n=1 Tax=Microbispora triticiradicis TaxID=2200763 RepID=UPI001AD6B767|nr:hypothetical protein [Microbispora triticiradicis]MBO4273030.1 hypothetical protein [Microbispora triticiradicis]